MKLTGALIFLLLATNAPCQKFELAQGSRPPEAGELSQEEVQSRCQFIWNVLDLTSNNPGSMRLMSSRTLRKTWTIRFDQDILITFNSVSGDILGLLDNVTYCRKDSADLSTHRLKVLSDVESLITALVQNLGVIGPRVIGQISLSSEVATGTSYGVRSGYPVLDDRIALSMKPLDGKVYDFYWHSVQSYSGSSELISEATAWQIAQAAYNDPKYHLDRHSADMTKPLPKWWMIPRLRNGKVVDIGVVENRVARLAWRCSFGPDSVFVDQETGEVCFVSFALRRQVR